MCRFSLRARWQFRSEKFLGDERMGRKDCIYGVLGGDGYPLEQGEVKVASAE